MIIDWSHVARDGGVLALGACAIVAGLLRANPRLFMRHFPEPVRARLAPLSRRETQAGAAGGLLLVGWVVGLMLVSTLRAEARGADVSGLFVHAWLVGMAFNLADWLIVDELWLGLARPRWALPAGTDPAEVPFEHGKHFRDFLKGALIFAVLAAAIAGGVAFV